MISFTKTSFFLGLFLLAYGYLCRILKIYFFWDSKTFGWIILFIALVSLLFDLYKSRRRRGKKTIWVTIGICFLLFGLIILPVVVFKLKTSDAYLTAIEYLKSDSLIKKQIGNVKGFGLIPTGTVESVSINGAKSGDASFNIIIRGEKKYKDVTIDLKKTPQFDWRVITVE